MTQIGHKLIANEITFKSVICALHHLPFHPLKQNVDEKVDGRVEDDESVRHLLNVLHPGGPRPHGADRHLVGAGDDLPDVAEEEEPHDGQGDASQAVLAPAAHLKSSISFVKQT